MKEPFINLPDVAGILMICAIICVILAALGSKLISWSVVLVIGILFAGAVFFAKRGAP